MGPMKVYVITGEYNGIQDECMVFLIERCAIEKFEELTECSWQEYLDGKYEYTEGEYFYRFFECVQEDYGEDPNDDDKRNERYECDFCGTQIGWEEQDDVCGEIWGCEKCGRAFCTKCLIDKVGRDAYMKRMQSGNLILCPDCFEPL